MDLAQPLAGALAHAALTPGREREVVPIPADRYVSASASGGYAVGDNGYDGLTPQTPWLTIEFALANAPAGAVIAVNSGVYTAATLFNFRRSLTLRAQRRHGVILRAPPGQLRVLNLTTTTGASAAGELDGVVIDAEGKSYAVMVGASTFGLADVVGHTLRHCRLIGASVSPLINNGHRHIAIQIHDCAVEGSGSGHLLALAFLEAGAVQVDGLLVDASGPASGPAASAVMVNAEAPGVAVVVRRVAGHYAGEAINGITVRNCDGALIEHNALDVAAGHLIRVHATSASLSANDAVIRHNRGRLGPGGSYCVLVGDDSATAGMGRHNRALIHDNEFWADPATPGVVHGLMLGYGEGGEVRDNTLHAAGIPLLAKNQLGSLFVGNRATGATYAGLYARGADVEFRDNLVEVVAGRGVLVEHNTSDTQRPSAAVLTGNTLQVVDAQYVVDVLPDQTASFSGNRYQLAPGASPGPWRYHGTSYPTLAAWKTVEPSAQP